MAFGGRNTETITIIRPPGKDTFGDPLPGQKPEFDVDGCLFAPGSTSEDLDGANQTTTAATIYAPAGTDVRETDQVRARGDLYEVAGKPGAWANVGVEIRLRRITG